MCRWHHGEQHNQGIILFQEKYGVDLERAAIRVTEEWIRLGKDTSGIPPKPLEEPE